RRRRGSQIRVSKRRQFFIRAHNETLSIAMRVSCSEPSFLGKRELEHRSARSEKTISRAAFRGGSVEVPVRAHDHTSGWRRSVAAPVEAMQHRIIPEVVDL